MITLAQNCVETNLIINSVRAFVIPEYYTLTFLLVYWLKLWALVATRTKRYCARGWTLIHNAATYAQELEIILIQSEIKNARFVLIRKKKKKIDLVRSVFRIQRAIQLLSLVMCASENYFTSVLRKRYLTRRLFISIYTLRIFVSHNCTFSKALSLCYK